MSLKNNFKTSALGASNPMSSTNSAQNASGVPNSRPSQQPSQLQQPQIQPSPISAYNTPTSPQMSYQQNTSQNANYPTGNMSGQQKVGTIPPPSMNSASMQQQNQLNNNSAHVQPNTLHMGQRKPMYPSNQQLPPMMQQQQQSLPPQSSQQQQQPYSAAYNYPPQQQLSGPSQSSGIFNGQPNTGPLQYQNQNQPYQQQTANYPAGSVVHQGFNRLWGQDTIDLMQNRHILSPATLTPPKIVLHNQFHESINCNPKYVF